MYFKYFKPFPNICSDTLILRDIRRTDAADLFKSFGDKLVTKYVTWDTYKSIGDTMSFINFCLYGYSNGTCYTWSVESVAEKQVIGTISLLNLDYIHKTAQIGYSYGSKHWGKGYATLAVNMLVDYCFKQKIFNAINAKCVLENTASQRVLEKCGFIRSPHLQTELVKNVERQIAYYYLENNG